MIINEKGRVILSGQVLGFRFEAALLYAFRLHAKQQRKGSRTPYIGHLLGVASGVIEAGGDEDQVIAGLLHDAIEDQGGEPTRAAIETLFGERVANIVVQCSDEDPESIDRMAENWPVRKQRYLEHLHGASYDVLIVSLADKIYNARSVLFDLRQKGEELWSRFNVGKEQQLWYYRGLVTAFSNATHRGSLSLLVEELDRIVKEIEQEASTP